MTEPHKTTFARWTRRNGFRLAQLALLAWIALELHGLNDQATSPSVDPADVAEIADRLDDIVDAMPAADDKAAGVETIALAHRPRHHAARHVSGADRQRL